MFKPPIWSKRRKESVVITLFVFVYLSKKLSRLCKIALGLPLVPDENNINPGEEVDFKFLIKLFLFTTASGYLDI